jgi:hypothetical protein
VRSIAARFAQSRRTTFLKCIPFAQPPVGALRWRSPSRSSRGRAFVRHTCKQHLREKSRNKLALLRERSGVGKRVGFGFRAGCGYRRRVAMSAFIPAPLDSQPRCRHLLNAPANSGLFLAVKRGPYWRCQSQAGARKASRKLSECNYRRPSFHLSIRELLHVEYRVRNLQRHALHFVQRRLRFAPDS